MPTARVCRIAGQARTHNPQSGPFGVRSHRSDSMGQQEASAAIGGLKDVVMADPELRAIAEAAKSIDELSALWKNEAFRAAHDRLIGDVQEQDVRDYLSELSDEQLDHVAGGAVMTSTKFNKMNTRQVYVAALGQAMGQPDSFFDIFTDLGECRI